MKEEVFLLLDDSKSIDTKESLPESDKEKFFEKIRNGESESIISLLKKMPEIYYCDEAFWQRLAEAAAEQGLYSIVQNINLLNPNAIIPGQLAYKLLLCPHGQKIESLQIGALFNIGTDLYRNAVIATVVDVVSLILAAKHKRNEKLQKKSEIPQLVLNDNEGEIGDFVEYLKANSTKPEPFEIHFIIADYHWQTCALRKDENGELELIIIDSLGHDNFSNIRFSLVKEFPNLKSYLLEIKRQHNEVGGCRAFSIDDLLHLSSYPNIFPYVQNHIISTNKSKESKVTFPLSFIRTKQSLNGKPEENLYKGGLYPLMRSNIYSEEEQNVPVNKKGESFWQSVNNHIKTVGGKKQNKRLDYKIENMRKLLLDYLLDSTTSWEEIVSSQQPFKLEGFKQYNVSFNM